MTNQPITQEKDRLLSTSIFTRTADINGRNVTFYSVSVQRAYKKKGDTEYTRESINLDSEDLLKMANLLTETYNEIRKLAKAPKTAPAKSVDDSWGENVIQEDGIPF